MSEYIKREDVEKAILDCPISGMLDLINLQTAITNIDAIPSADVVEVVRCKYCKYSRVADMDDQEDGYLCSLLRGHEFFSYDYCSYGERKDNE